MDDRGRKKSLGEEAYTILRDNIVTLGLKPGSRINESDLLRDLGIGRTPVREALLRLVSEGFLNSIPGRGFFVREITLDGIRDLFEAVMILERGSIALAARRISAAEIVHLEDIHQQIAEAMADKQYLQVTLLNSSFHRIIHQASRNDLLITSLYNLEPQYDRLAYLCFSKESEADELKKHFEKVADDHGRLVSNLKSGEENASIDAITGHIHLFHGRVTKYLSPPMRAILAAQVDGL